MKAAGRIGTTTPETVLDWRMGYVADLHLHSRYAYATSKHLSLGNLITWAGLKGIDLLASADFTHPAWLEELRLGLADSGLGSPDSNEGFYHSGGVRFVLGTEVSCVYRQGGRGRRLHILLFAPDFEAVDSLNRAFAKYGRLDTDGRPTLAISARDLVSLALDCNPRCIAIPAHLWTPWYGALGSKSGFDSLEECFRDMLPHIHAVETGLSSDPAMNWQVAELEDKSIVSFSDAHSPAKLGREVTVFEGEMSYDGLARALEERAIAYTVEFYPEEGKYHYSGHRNCGVALGPEESRRSTGRCPNCGRPLTLGVKHRVSELAENAAVNAGPSEELEREPEPSGRPPYVKLLPLQEIMAQSMGVGAGSKRLQREYRRIVSQLGGELRVLNEASEEEISMTAGEPLARLVTRARDGHLSVTPGYDGVYGQVRVRGDDGE